MPRGNGSGQRGQGSGGGRGMGQGGGGGRRGSAAGPGGDCICPNCGEKTAHRAGQPCFEQKCSKCGATMTRG